MQMALYVLLSVTRSLVLVGSRHPMGDGLPARAQD